MTSHGYLRFNCIKHFTQKHPKNHVRYIVRKVFLIRQCVHRSGLLSSSSHFECWSTLCLFWSLSVSCCFQTLFTQNHLWSYPVVMPFTHSLSIIEFPTCSHYPNLTPQAASTMLTNSLFQASKQSAPSCSPLLLCLLLILGPGKPVLRWSLHIQP